MAASCFSLWPISEMWFPVTWWLSVTKFPCLKFCDMLWHFENSVTKCDKVVSKSLWQTGIFVTFQNMLTLPLFVNKSTIIYKKFLVWENCQILNNGMYIAKYSIMVSTLRVVSEHFSVANCHFKSWFPAQEEKEDIHLPGGFLCSGHKSCNFIMLH